MADRQPLSPEEMRIRDLQVRIQQQKAHLQRMIAQGTIAQSDDDVLRQMYATLRQMQAARRLA